MTSAIAHIQAKPEFRLRIVQQPKAARACGNGDRDRRAIDPPPILAIEAVNSTLTAIELRQYLNRNPGIVHCDLIDAETHEDASKIPGATDEKPIRRLIGNVVSHICQPSDTSILPSAVAAFADLSVRTPGVFKLKFKFAILPKPEPGAKAIPEAFDTSDAFEVYNAKDFPGMEASSPLIEELRREGFNVPIRKGHNPDQTDGGNRSSTSASAGGSSLDQSAQDMGNQETAQ